MSETENKPKLSVKIRIIIGILAIPSMILAFMIGATIMHGDYDSIDYFEVMYSLVGIFAMHIALTGKRYF